MRSLVIIFVLTAGLAPSTPVFADPTRDPPAAAAHATLASSVRTNQSGPPALANLPMALSFQRPRPSVLPALYATSAALQGYDAFSTLGALRIGAREANPFMKGVVQSPAAFMAVKAGVTTASIVAAERLWKNNHRAGAIGLMVASNVVMGMVAARNTQVRTSLN
jgi:hypothetical protein